MHVGYVWDLLIYLSFWHKFLLYRGSPPGSAAKIFWCMTFSVGYFLCVSQVVHTRRGSGVRLQKP